MGRQTVKEKTALRVTIMIDPDNFAKLHNTQSTVIKKSNGTASFSRICNDILRATFDYPKVGKIPYPKNLTERRESHSDDSRVTIMIDKDNRREVIYTMTAEMKKCADDNCELPTLNFSRVINNIIRKGYFLKLDKKLVSAL